MNKNLNLKGVSPATWTRIIFLLIALVNQVAVSVFGAEIPIIDDAETYETVSTLITVFAGLVAGWKNNSVTAEAQKADEILKGGK